MTEQELLEEYKKLLSNAEKLGDLSPVCTCKEDWTDGTDICQQCHKPRLM